MNIFYIETVFLEGENTYRPPVFIEMDCRKVRKSIRFSQLVTQEDLKSFKVFDQIEYIKDESRFPKGFADRESQKPIAQVWFNCIAQVLIANSETVKYFQSINGIDTEKIDGSEYSIIIPVFRPVSITQLLEEKTLFSREPYAYTIENSTKIFLNNSAAELAGDYGLNGIAILPVTHLIIDHLKE